MFYRDYKEKFEGKTQTFIQAMILHRRAMRIIDNLHDLCCRGTKNYKTALENVNDFNMAKILYGKCTVSNYSGDIKQGELSFDLLFNLQMDIELYNYIHILFHDYFSKRLKLTIDKYEEEEEDQQKPRINAGATYIPVDEAPLHIRLHRNNVDFMNNFNINIVARTFTDIETTINEYLAAYNSH